MKLLTGATLWAGADCAPAPGWLLVDGDRIAALGTDTPPEGAAEVVDLTGRHVLPGFVDTHTHLTVAAWHPHGGDAGDWRGLRDALHAVRRAAAADPDAPWLLFWNASLHAWPEGRLPTAAELDAAAPGRKVLVSGADLHRGSASTPALAHARGPKSDRTAAGELWEAAYGTVLRQALADQHDDDALAAEARRHLALGITHAHDPYVPPGAHETLLDLAGRTPLRLSWATGPPTGIFDPPVTPAQAPDGPYGQARREVKIFLDGADRCALRVPHSALPGMIGGTIAEALRRRALGPLREGMRRTMRFTRAGIELPYLRLPDADLVATLAAYAEAGFALRLHALGNLAADQAARALLAARVPAGLAVLDHLTGLDRRTAELVAASGAVAAVQPGFVPAFGGQFATTRLDRHLAVAGAGLLTAAGAPPVLSSDHPCGPLDPLANLRVAAGRTFQPEQAVGRAQAVAAYTTRAAASIGAPGAGGLAPGEVADLAVCDGDPFDEATRVIATWIAGNPT